MSNTLKKTGQGRINLRQAIRRLFFGDAAGQGSRGAQNEQRYRGGSLQIHPTLETLEGRALMAVVADLGSDTSAPLAASTTTTTTMEVAMSHAPRHNDVDAED